MTPPCGVAPPTSSGSDPETTLIFCRQGPSYCGVMRIEAGLMIPGRGDPVEDAVVVVDGDTIVFAGPRDTAPADPGADVISVPVVMPGMWDCHGHFSGERSADLATIATMHPALMGIRVAGDASRVLAAGFTSVREVGGVGVHLRRAIDEGTLVGPHIYAAGAILSPTGGHADLHMYPVEWVRDLCDRQGVLQICDGVPDCLRAVRLQLRQGAELIKICTSGGVLSEVDHPVHQQFSADELRAIVEEAGRADRIVAAHCHGKPGIMAALEAGCRTIEHGTYLDEEAADAMRELDATLVPTCLIINELLTRGRDHGLPDYAYRKLVVVAERHREALQIAIARGVRIALGTDVAATGEHLPGHWGQNAEELPLLVAAGLTPLQAIEAATANGPHTLGDRAPRSGQIAAGYDADLLALTGSPLDDIGVLTKAATITHIWKGGTAAKAPDANA
jgi:imidazolonepropionase-like amidohydrolase